MKLGVVVDGHWGFINELIADWQSHFETQVFAFNEIELPFARGRLNAWRQKQTLSQFLTQNQVVFFEWAGPLLVLASHLPVEANIVVRLHSFELFDYAPQICWEAIGRVVLVSEAMQRHFCELYPSFSDRTTVIYNGVALDKFGRSSPADSGIIGMLGDVKPLKRVYEVILAIYELNKSGKRFTLHIAGPPEQGADAVRYYLAVQRLVRQLGLEDQVRFLGKVSEPASFLRTLEIFVSNSYWEGQQVALLEAMASGCYCLSHIWDGAAEVLPEDYLFVSDAELREKLTHYCAAPIPIRRQYQEAMRATAIAKFNIEETKVRMRNIICTVPKSKVA